MSESSFEILGHSVDGVTYRHYAHRDPLAYKAILTLPQPTAFTALHHGFDGSQPLPAHGSENQATSDANVAEVPTRW